MPIVTYIASNLFGTLGGPTHDKHGEPILRALDFSLSESEMMSLHSDKHAASLCQIMEKKIVPKLLSSTQMKCNSCHEHSATRMVSTVTFHPNAPEGKVILDNLPIPICMSSRCNVDAQKAAHHFRIKMTRFDSHLKDNEMEQCSNCGCMRRVQKEKEGRIKICRCKAALYCSRSCQKKYWKGGHKLVCKGL